MTAINKNNYEVFLLDHMEGRLDAAQTAALMLFLDENPGFKDELEGLELVRLQPNNQIRFDAKDNLKKPLIFSSGNINEQNYEEYFVAALEGDLSEAETGNLKAFLVQNPGLQKEYAHLQICRLQPATDIVFADKAALKKTVFIPFLTRRLYYGIAVAASLALMIGLSFLFEPAPDRPVEIAQTEKTEDPGLKPQVQIPETSAVPGQPSGEIQNQASAPSQLDSKQPGDTKIRKTEKTIRASRELTPLNQLASLPAPASLENAPMPKPASDERVYFSRYYNDIAMAQNMRHAEWLAEEPSAEKLLAQGSAMVKEIFQPGDQEIQILPQQINLWQIADVGINGFARITGADLEFRKKEDDEGKVVSFAFESQSMLISRNLPGKK